MRPSTEPEDNHRDRSEHELEEYQGSHREGQLRHAGRRCRYHRLARCERRGGRQRRFAEERKPLLSERHVVVEENPDDQHRGESVEAHESRIDRPFLLDIPGVENRQAGNALQADKGCSRQLPCIVSRIEPFW
jgi:hypothetical protein